MNTRQGTLDGRAVELREINIGAALAANRASGGNAFETSLHVLVASAVWADGGEPVFADRAAIDLLPMRQMREVSALANLAADVNSPEGMPAAPPSTTNGTGAEIHPSP